MLTLVSYTDFFFCHKWVAPGNFAWDLSRIDCYLPSFPWLLLAFNVTFRSKAGSYLLPLGYYPRNSAA